MQIDVEKYGPAFAPVLEPDRLMPLGPGEPNTSKRAALEALKLDDAFAHTTIEATAYAEACIAGAWLMHNYLDESHRISQGVENPTGSFWHAIMHRREPDYSNARYWFAKVGDHPVYPQIAAAAAELAETSPAKAGRQLAQTDRWDPDAFVAYVADVEAGKLTTADVDLAHQIQHREWWLLFDFSYKRATGQQ
jgi:hypothetical protein